MKRDQKFLSKLEIELKNSKIKKEENILNKYRNLINDRKKSGERVSDILADLGSPCDIVNKELELIKQKKKAKKKLKKVKKESNVENEFSKNENKENKKDTVKEKKRFNFNFLFKSKKKNDLEKKEKKINFKSLFKRKKKIDVVESKNEEIIVENEVINNNELSISENNKKKKVILMIILFILLILESLIFILFISTCFAVLDGIKFYGIPLAVLGLVILFGYISLYIYIKIIGKRFLRVFSILFVIISILCVCFGISLSLRSFYNIEYINDVNEKYTMSTKIENYTLPLNNKMYITFNSNYHTKYIVEYSNNLDSSIKIETKYYEAYYDYIVKKSSNNIYISLKENSRDRLSVYISDLKENKIYDNSEFSRYTVKITINEKDKDRVVIE